MDNSKCRLCLNQLGNMKNIFQHKLGCQESLSDILYWVFKVEVDALDPYSKCICDDCLTRIQYIVTWRNKFQNNQQFLQSTLNKNMVDRKKNSPSQKIVNGFEQKPIESPLFKRVVFACRGNIRHTQKETMDVVVNHIKELVNNIENRSTEDWSVYKKDTGTQTNQTSKSKIHDKKYLSVHQDALLSMAPRVMLQDFKHSINNFRQIGKNTFKEMKDKPAQDSQPVEDEHIRISTKALEKFCPRVQLEDFNEAIENENFVQTSDMTFRKQNSSVEHIRNYQKKSKYIDYYYNYKSYAIRELITSKDFRDFRDTKNSIFVCEVCSKEYNSQLSHDLHYVTAHRNLRQAKSTKNMITHKLGKEKKQSVHQKCKKKMVRENMLNKFLSNSKTNSKINGISKHQHCFDRPNKKVKINSLNNSYLSEVIKKLADRLSDEVRLK